MGGEELRCPLPNVQELTLHLIKKQSTDWFWLSQSTTIAMMCVCELVLQVL